MRNVIKNCLAQGIFSSLSDSDREALAECMDVIRFAAGDDIPAAIGFCILLSGEVAVRHDAMDVAMLAPGDAVGGWGIWGWMQSRLSVCAVSDAEVARLNEETFKQWIVSDPERVLRVMRTLPERLDGRLGEISQMLLSIYNAPAKNMRSTVNISVNGQEQTVRIGTPLASILPTEIDGLPVISALFNNKNISLNRPLYTSGRVEPITTKGLEGRLIYRQSLVLLAVEAAHQVDPGVKLRVGPSVGYAYIIEVIDANGHDLGDFAAKMDAEMKRLVRENVIFKRDYCSLEEARARFMAQGWADAVRILKNYRSSSVPLVSCGDVYAMEIVPLVASAGVLKSFSVRAAAENNELLLFHSDEERAKTENLARLNYGTLVKQHDTWLRGLGLTSVGAFNDLAVSGDVDDLIRVSEGFHEKRISQIADKILQAKPRVKVICIAGPSSSGKTTFLKRLSIQLQVNGLMPKCISLDDYYVDRERTVRDENGEYDFEAFEALDIPLLGEHLHALIHGETVKTAHYDFKTGISHHHGGPEITLGEHDVLLLEGIHGLNPRMPFEQGDGVFRIFINPMTSLPLDNVNRVSASDIRLLRRIVRDRYTRGITAESNILRWPSVRRGEIKHIFPYQNLADAFFNTSLVYELAVLKVYAERYLLEVPEDSPAQPIAFRLRRLIDKIVAIYPEYVPPTSILREFVGGSSFKY